MASSCPVPTLPPLWAIPWPWQAPVWWLLWLVCMGIVAYPVRYNYRIYRELREIVSPNVNWQWVSVMIVALTVGICMLTICALVVLPGLFGFSAWAQGWELRRNALHCDTSVVETMRSQRGLTYALINLCGVLVLFVVQFPLLVVSMILRDKARAAARTAPGGGAAAERPSVG